MQRKVLLILSLLGCLSAPAWAAIQPGAFTLSPMIGGYLFEGNQSLDNSVFGSLGLGYNLTKQAALEAVFGYTNADAEDSSTTDTRVKTYRLDALYHFMPDNKLVPYLAIGFGGITLNPKGSGDRDHFLANYGGGIKYFINESMALRADIRHLLDFPNPNNNLLYSAGVIFQFGAPARAAKPVVVPPPPAKPVAPPSPLDSDGDGVIDNKDQCPNTPRGAPVNVVGCPLDSDGDGVADYQDRCPNTPIGAAVDNQGCPLDSDADGVFDYLDKCPGTPKGVSVDRQGCPTKLTLHINFGHDSSAIGSAYRGEIAKAARCINQYPGNSVFIDGHTDSQGAADYNQRLSDQRVTAVKISLTKNFNIPAARMIARGFGESKPVADNSTKEGRFQNRRVEVACGATE